MAEIIDLQPRQTELSFPSQPSRMKRTAQGSSRAHAGPPSPPIARPALSRRWLAPQTRRLEISPEAFAADESGGALRPEARTSREGLLEAVLVLLATVAFGLAWVVVEEGRVEMPASGYDAAADSAAEEEAWTNAIDVAAYGSSKP